MDSRSKYPGPPIAVPKLKSAITPIHEVKSFADAMSILRMLQDGAEGLQRQLDVLRLEDFVGDVGRLARDPRKVAIEARLTKMKAAVPQPAAAAVQADHPAAVVQALELLRTDSPRLSRRIDRKELGARLLDDLDVVRAAISVQSEIIDQIRDRLSMEQARKAAPEYRAMIVRLFRNLQQVAHTTDELRDFHRSVSAAGFTARPDLLPALPSRAPLVLGSESTHDSEISRARLMLEDLKWL